MSLPLFLLEASIWVVETWETFGGPGPLEDGWVRAVDCLPWFEAKQREAHLRGKFSLIKVRSLPWFEWSPVLQGEVERAYGTSPIWGVERCDEEGSPWQLLESWRTLARVRHKRPWLVEQERMEQKSGRPLYRLCVLAPESWPDLGLVRTRFERVG